MNIVRAQGDLANGSLLCVDGEGEQAPPVWLGLDYMIDVEHAVIIDVEATPARTYDEVAATRTMIDRS